jgi:RNA polymerase sigma factor (sigma-70 family)
MEENKLIYLLKKEITKNHTKYDAETLDKMFNEGKRDEIIKSLLPLVLYVSGSFTNQYQYEDFISVGNIGLIKAVDTYKVESNMNLITYSKYMIRWAILDYIQTDYTFILYPRKKKHYVKEKPPKLERVEYQQEKHIEKGDYQ